MHSEGGLPAEFDRPRPLSAAFSPDGKFVVRGGEDIDHKLVMIADAETGAEVRCCSMLSCSS
jgi:hypothetical protein